jgi:nucleoside-diphosphate-sugar epimerase
MSDRFLVTGGAGFIGSHLVKRLIREGGKIRVVDDLSTGKEERLSSVRSGIEFLKGDLADPAVCNEAVRDVDFVFHQAAIPSVQRSMDDPLGTNQANVVGTVNLLESSRQNGVRRFVYAASSSAYGNSEVLPKEESMVPNPCSFYALQKFIGERYCQLYHDLFGLETVSLRYFNVFGPEQDPDSEYSAVIPKFIDRLLAGKPLVVYGDGEQSRDFTYVENAVQANLLALRADGVSGKVFNVGCGQNITLNRMIRVLESIVSIEAHVTYAPARAGDVRHSLADLTLATRYLSYEPVVTVEEGLKRTVDAMKAKAAAVRDRTSEGLGRSS